MEFHWMRPEWLWSLIPAIILFALLWRQRQRSGSWHSVIAPELLRHLVSDIGASRSSNLLPMVLLGWLLAAIAASGPSWHKIPQPVHQKQDALVVVLDLSYSMNSADPAPSRLDRARQKILDLLQYRREGQTGLIAYAGDSHIVTPLTDDTPTIANLLPALHPEMMPIPGSEPVSAVTQALELLRSAGIRRGKILLVTDGVSERDREGIETVLTGSNAQLAILGVGTATGAPIPLPGGGFMRDDNGTIVMPGLEETGLRELAAATGGSYQRMVIDESDFKSLLVASPLDNVEETLALDRTADTWEDQGYLFILALLPLALALFRRGWLIAALPVVFLVQPEPATAQSWNDLWLTQDQQGQRALQQGDAEGAASLFENSDWAGTAAYQSGDYEMATEKFENPASSDSLYNRGNALARTGKLDDAISAYEQSLGLLPDQSDAKENLALVKKLKEQQEQEQEQAKDQNEEQEQNQQQDQSQQQDQDQQQDQSQDQDQDQDQDQQQQDQQQDQSQQQNETEQQQGEDDEARGQQAEDEQSEQEAQDQMAAGIESGDEERDQAMEQWLRRIPDDPSGLLRQKFRYESQQRQQQQQQQQGGPRDEETYW